MIAVIPLMSKESVFSQSTSLDGVDFTIRFSWNGRARRWFWLLEDSAGDIVVGWRKLVCNAPMLAHFDPVGGPAGDLWCVTTTGEDPGLFDLGSKALVMYVSADAVTT